MNKFWRIWLSVSAGVTLSVSGAQAQWIGSGTETGPFDYSNPAYWTGGIVSGVFPASTPPGLTVTFDKDTVLRSGTSISITNSATTGDITFRGTGGDQMLTLAGDVVTKTNAGSRYYTGSCLAQSGKIR